MLILSRRIGESLVIGENIFFTVLGIKGNQVRIGIEAPSDSPVHRFEIYQKIKFEKKYGFVDTSKKFSSSYRNPLTIRSKEEIKHDISSI